MFSVQGLKEHTFRKPLLFFQQIKWNVKWEIKISDLRT
jgi:hypothetical protein